MGEHMAHYCTSILDEHEPFPPLTISLTDERLRSIPTDLGPGYGILLLYRGRWCPHCRRQLVDFQQHAEALRGRGVAVLAASTDTREDAIAFAQETGFSFPVGYGLSARSVARATGCFFDAHSGSLHPAGFILTPRGEVALAAYSTGDIGRLGAADCLLCINTWRKNGPRTPITPPAP